MASGWREGREPAPQFDVLTYCLTRGITYATQNPLMHYVLPRRTRPAGPGRGAGPAGRDPGALVRRRPLPARPRRGPGRGAGRRLRRRAAAPLRRGGLAGAGAARARTSTRPGFVQARAGSRAVRDDPFFRYVAEARLTGQTPFAEPHRLNLPAVDADWYRATYPDVRGDAALPALRRGGLAGAARSGPGALDAGGAAAGLRAAPGAGARRGHRLARGDRREPVDRAAVLDLQARLVAGHFDHAFYRARYGLSEEADAVRDYCDTGWRQGRNPRPDFNGWAYRDASSLRARRPGSRPSSTSSPRRCCAAPTSRPAAFDPRYGAPPAEEDAALVEQARLIEPYFDAALVRSSATPTPRGARGGPLAHFVAHGQHEGRDPSKTFSIAFYRRGLRAPVRAGRVAVPALRAHGPGRRADGRARGSRHLSAHDGPRAARLGRPAPGPAHRARPASSSSSRSTRAAARPCAPSTPACRPRRPPPSPCSPSTTAPPTPQLAADLAALAAPRPVPPRREPAQPRLRPLGQPRPVPAPGPRRRPAQLRRPGLRRLARPPGRPRRAPAEPRRGPRRRGLPVGSVTPLSNNATICSYPRFNANNTMPLEIARPDLDRMAARINRGRAVPVPTGVGFCMYMTAAGPRRRRRPRRRGLRQGLRRGERLVPARHQGRVRQPARRGRVRPPCRPDLVRARRGRRVRPGPGGAAGQAPGLPGPGRPVRPGRSGPARRGRGSTGRGWPGTSPAGRCCSSPTAGAGASSGTSTT